MISVTLRVDGIVPEAARGCLRPASYLRVAPVNRTSSEAGPL